MEELNSVDLFDDIIKCYDALLHTSCEQEFLLYIKMQTSHFSNYEQLEKECKQLDSSLEDVNRIINVLQEQLTSARNLLDFKRHQNRENDHERDVCTDLLDQIEHFIDDSNSNIPSKIKNQLNVTRVSMGNLQKNTHYGRYLNSAEELLYDSLNRRCRWYHFPYLRRFYNFLIKKFIFCKVLVSTIFFIFHASTFRFNIY